MREVELVGRHARPLDGLVARIADARIVLLGEPTHGSHEVYAERARITRRLIAGHGFAAVAVEADWPDAWRVRRWVVGEGSDPSAERALSGFQRFPQWMWRNADVLDFVGWLRDHNRRTGAQVGFHGLDLYSLHRSMAEVVRHLEVTDPEAAVRARDRYACFDRYGDEPQAYGMLAGAGVGETCESDVVRQLLELLARDTGDDEAFAAAQNARLVRDAEAYYRAMFRSDVSSWNLRDTHMADALDALLDHVGGRVVVWAHNSHVGDARATAPGRRGELTLGQLVRERHPDAVLVGFSTATGTVTAASAWDALAERKRVRPPLDGSWEDVLHRTEMPRFFVDLRAPELAAGLDHERPERAIGVLYLPETERRSHYFGSVLPRRYDLMVHLDHTRAVEPLDPPRGWRPHHEDPPETFPTGL